MNRQLAKAIVECFRADARGAERLHQFPLRDWHSTKSWLDASGLAIYFLQRVRELGIEGVLAPSFAAELRRNAEDHKNQVDQQFAEFASVVKAFQEHEIPFAVQKGFSLVPEYCPDPALRLQ